MIKGEVSSSSSKRVNVTERTGQCLEMSLQSQGKNPWVECKWKCVIQKCWEGEGDKDLVNFGEME